MYRELLKEIQKLYKVSEERAKEMVKEEKAKLGNIISDVKAMTYLINKKKYFR